MAKAITMWFVVFVTPSWLSPWAPPGTGADAGVVGARSLSLGGCWGGGINGAGRCRGNSTSAGTVSVRSSDGATSTSIASSTEA